MSCKWNTLSYLCYANFQKGKYRHGIKPSRIGRDLSKASQCRGQMDRVTKLALCFTLGPDLLGVTPMKNRWMQIVLNNRFVQVALVVFCCLVATTVIVFVGGILLTVGVLVGAALFVALLVPAILRRRQPDDTDAIEVDAHDLRPPSREDTSD